MLGLFMLIPVFTVYAPKLEGATALLTGIALGGYGLSQGLLQMPFGMLSDRYGRKTLITIGLLFFVAGSLLGALTDSIYGMIVARFLQGAGAIGSVLIALLADLTPERERTKAMALIGATIGISFSLAMVLSPGLSATFGLAGIFYFTTILAIAGLLLLHIVIPTPLHERALIKKDPPLVLLKSALRNPALQRLNAGIFFQHAILTATFYVIPLLLQKQVQAGNLSQPWHYYLPLMVLSFLLMLPLIYYAERRQQQKGIFVLSIFATCIAQGGLIFFYPSWWLLCLLTLLYFIAFNVLEASLPSMVSKLAEAHAKGTAMGVYSTCQFLGIFVGGVAAGFLFEHGSSTSIFMFNAVLSLGWGVMALASIKKGK